MLSRSTVPFPASTASAVRGLLPTDLGSEELRDQIAANIRRPADRAGPHLGICIHFAAHHGIHELRVYVLPTVQGGHRHIEETRDFLVSHTQAAQLHRILRVFATIR